MSNVTRLNLAGVKEHLARQPRAGVKQPFTINTEEYPIATGQSESSSSRGGLIGILFLLGFGVVFSTSKNVWPEKPPVTKQIDQGLRKILRMPCATDGNTHCSANTAGGDYVVHVGSCKDVYEFNGIPFTDIKIDSQGNYHVPASQDMSLTMVKGCENLSVTLDTYSTSFTEYASKNQGVGNLKRVVWITKKCFTGFTLKINHQVVFDKTPVKMITSKSLHNYVAYIYVVNGKVDGPVSVIGEGCQSPVNIYTLRN